MLSFTGGSALNLLSWSAAQSVTVSERAGMGSVSDMYTGALFNLPQVCPSNDSLKKAQAAFPIQRPQALVSHCMQRYAGSAQGPSLAHIHALMHSCGTSAGRR